jgi:hypothetical protein
VPETLVEELLRIARAMDEGEALPVTGNQAKDQAALKEAADTFLMTIPPRDRRDAKKLLYKFIDSVGAS